MSLGPPELLLILVIVLIIFGAGKLPQVLGSLGKGVKEFREASEDKGPTSTTSPTSAAPQSGVDAPGVAPPVPNSANTIGAPNPVVTAPPVPAERSSDTMSTS
ncbi:MAG TPA: twin-arginine translocase TatA/TatE family subunit [Chloroflexia bacterium]|nr:twin-arginine translocase TatA/TatE family subunit [Chloroflexia bacterium]